MLNNKEYNLLKTFCSPNPAPKNQEDLQRFQSFIDRKYLLISSVEENLKPSEWIITARGLDALSEFEQEHNKQAQEKRQQRFQNKISVLNLFVPLITFILGLIVESQYSIFDYFISLFH